MVTLILVGGVSLAAGLVIGLLYGGLLSAAGTADALNELSRDAARWRGLEAELRGQGWQCVSPQLIAARLPATLPSCPPEPRP